MSAVRVRRHFAHFASPGVQQDRQLMKRRRQEQNAADAPEASDSEESAPGPANEEASDDSSEERSDEAASDNELEQRLDALEGNSETRGRRFYAPDSHVSDHAGFAQSFEDLRAEVAALQRSDEASNAQFMERLDELSERLDALEGNEEPDVGGLRDDLDALRDEFEAHTHAPGAVLQQAFVDLPSQGVRR